MGVGALVVLAAVGWMTLKPSPTPVAPAVAAEGRAADVAETLPVPVETPEPTAEERLTAFLDEAPVLTTASARDLTEDIHRRGAGAVHPLDAAFLAAGNGFKVMDRQTLGEISTLFDEILGAAGGERDQIQGYLEFARAGRDLSPSAVESGRALLVKRIKDLDPATRSRLQQLLGMAVTLGIEQRLKAEERARLAALNPVELAGPESVQPTPSATSRGMSAGSASAGRTARTTAGGGRSASRRSARGESYWRGRAASARAAVERAESRVRDLEEKARRLGPYTPGPKLAECQTGSGIGGPDGVIRFRDTTKGTITCDGEAMRINKARDVNAQLQTAKSDLARAKKGLDDLADEARRAGALPGWLR